MNRRCYGPVTFMLGGGVVAASDEACRILREAASAGVAAFVARTREPDLARPTAYLGE